MAKLIIKPGAHADIRRIIGHLVEHQASHIPERIVALISALDVLQLHPEMGRPVGHGWRELVIGRGAQGYVALYRFDPGGGAVLVTAIRAQRERGFVRRK